MPKLIRNRAVENDLWTVLKEATGPEVLKVVLNKNFIVPIRFWEIYKSEIEEYSGQIAIWLDSDEMASDIEAELHNFPLIALNFPVFSDGRSYTNARELRGHLNYQGEIRAIGDVLRDQLFYMSRCGFNTFAIRHDQDPNACIQALSDFSTGYQACTVEAEPLFRRF